MTEAKEAPYKLGTKVLKHSGDYHLKGTVVASFLNRKGRVRYVVEHPIGDGAFYHIYSPDNIVVLGDE